MARPTLSRYAVRLINRSVEHVFDRLKGRFLGPDYIRSRGDKMIFVGYKPELSMPGIYRQATAEEATKPDETVLAGIVRVAESYLDARRELTKAKVVHAVNAWLADAAKKGVTTNVETVLGGELADVWGQAAADVHKIIDTEGITARNLGSLEGIVKINAASGIEDPGMFFVVVRDGELCDECRRLHLIAVDGTIVPRVWRLSEISNGYHKRGATQPSMAGLHPHCRCTPATLMPGFGFDGSGRVRYISPTHDEFARQRG